MRSHTTKRFRDLLARLPQEVQQQARHTYERFAEDPNYPSLQFRKVHEVLPIFSVRVGIHFRAVGTVSNNEIVWFWIGSHSDYDKLLAQL